MPFDLTFKTLSELDNTSMEGVNNINVSTENIPTAMEYTSTGNMSYDPEKCNPAWVFLKFRAVLDIPVVGLLCIFGLAGNTASILVLRTDGISNNVTFLLQALALADNAYLITCLFFQTLKAMNDCTDWIGELKNVYPYVEQYIWPCASIAQTASQWIVVLVTSERYMAVCVPLRKQCCFSGKTIRWITFAIPFIAIAYNIPRFFEFQVRPQYQNCLGEQRLIVDKTSLRMNKMYFLIYKTILFFLFRFIIPMSVLLIFNTKLIQTIHQAKKSHELMTKRNMKVNHALNAMLATVVTIYIVCQMPDFILRMLITLSHFGAITLNQWGLYYTNAITNMLLTINSSINCLVYCLTGSRFRKIFIRMFCRCFVQDCHKPATQKKNSLTRYEGTHPKVRLQARPSANIGFTSMKKQFSFEASNSYTTGFMCLRE